MEIIGMGLVIIGAIISVVAGIWFLIVAFRESILWGLGCMFVPFVSLIFLFMHWEDAKKPFLYSLLAAGIMVVGILLAPGSLSSAAG